jgi:hypothetical protein
MAKSERKTNQIELEPDAWARFERAVDVVAKSPPQHRAAKKKSPKSSKRIAAKGRNLRGDESSGL